MAIATHSGVSADYAPKRNDNATTAPTVTDDETKGYSSGSTWVNQTTDLSYICSDNTAGAAVWTNITAGGGGAAVWGGITGTITDQTDLNASLATKMPRALSRFPDSTTTGTNAAVTVSASTNYVALSNAGLVSVAFLSNAGVADGTVVTLENVNTSAFNLQFKDQQVSPPLGHAPLYLPIVNSGTYITVPFAGHATFIYDLPNTLWVLKNATPVIPSITGDATGTIGLDSAGIFVATLVGDSGSGGAKGLAPAPAAGDAAANKFLKASGAWATVPAGTATNANQDSFMVKMSTYQTINHNTATKIAFDVEDFDTAGSFDSTTNYRHTPTVAGKYLYSLTITGSTVVAGTYWIASIYKNGVAVFDTKTPNIAFNSSSSTSLCEPVIMNGTTDYVEFFVYQSSLDSAARNLLDSTSVAKSTHASGIFIHS